MHRSYQFSFLLATNNIVSWQTVFAPFLLKIMDGLRSLPSMTARRTERDRHWKHWPKTINACASLKAQEPPAGWLGKPYAMQQAFNHARGEWILATDADMIFHQDSLAHRSGLYH